ncbi:MAG TPA: protein kinase [archaeon]|nr:protein kinase [archaeon]
MICPNCGTENPTSNWYCLNCGINLREQPAPEAPRTAKKVSSPGKRKKRAAKEKTDGAEPGMFAGRYCDLVKIGDGAMATVFRACDTVLDQTVALKVLHPELAVNHDFIARFKREIALARTITHPNVYRIYDIGQTGETHFISMEYIEGRELKSLITGHRFDLFEGVKIIRQIALALEQAHEKGIVHRDLKPQNIMLETGSDRCVVMDFGIAIGETSSAITQTGTFVGTPEYIAPEQARSSSIDQRTDIYSLGIIIYEMFTGKLPFGPGKPVAVALSQISDTPVAPRKLAPELPAELESIILKTMAKDPDQRFKDAGQLVAALDSLLEQVSGTPKSGAAEAVGTPTGISFGQNPYFNRAMIRDRRYFYGRKKEISTIYSRLGAARPQSVSIVGERRIGKSSLLYHINDVENRRAFLKNPESYIFIFMDFQEKRRALVDDFFISLFEALKAEGINKIGPLPEPGYDGFKKVCEKLDTQNMKLVLLFDEFESITKNKNFDPEFFAFLRSIANNYNVAYVTSSLKNLQELCHNKEISDSPFFNIFSNLNLTAFSENEALLFVSEPSRIFGHPLEEHFDTVVDLAGYFPFYMAIACSILFDFDFNQVNPHKTIFENVEELFLDEAQMHFQFILNSITEDDKKTCRKIVTHKPLIDIDKYAIKDLFKRGYLIPGDTEDEVRIFSKTFARLLFEQMVKVKR